jgi:transcriptional regulator with XRE-family HTH domain
MNKVLKTKIYNILREKNLSLRDLEKIIDYSRGGLSQMINGETSFSKSVKGNLLPILEISEEEFESWVVASKYSPELIKKAVESSLQSHSELVSESQTLKQVQGDKLIQGDRLVQGNKCHAKFISASAQLVFTQNIDKILSEKNMSRTALSKSIKYSQSALNKIIMGKKPVSKTVLTRISELFEIPIKDLQAWVLADKYSLAVLKLALEANSQA